MFGLNYVSGLVIFLAINNVNLIKIVKTVFNNLIVFIFFSVFVKKWAKN